MRINPWALALVAGLLIVSPALAADHLDGPRASADPGADITDVYGWMSADAAKMYLVMNVSPGASSASKFSDKVQYVFHTNSSASYGATDSTTVNIICTFAADQKISCWAGDQYVTGDASATSGLASESGMLKVFAGLRNDPFFFSLDSFNAVAKTVVGAAPSLTFDTAGCPALSDATSTALVTGLITAADGSGGPAVDTFSKLNVLSIVVAVDKTIVTKGGPIVGVWGSTNKAQ